MGRNTSNTIFSSFGGMMKGGVTKIDAISSVKDAPNFIWAGYETSANVTTFKAFGHIAWDSQLVGDSTWTTQSID